MTNKPIPPNDNITKEIDKIGLNVIKSTVGDFVKKIKNKLTKKNN